MSLMDAAYRARLRALCDSILGDSRAVRSPSAKASEASRAVVAAMTPEAVSELALSAVMVAAFALNALEEAEAIIEGRETPPTDAEIEALAAEGGAWQVAAEEPSESVPTTCAQAVLKLARNKNVREGAWKLVWHALDARRRPRAWPVVEGGVP